MNKINLSVTPESAQDILRVLGQLPTSSGAFPLLVDLKKQCDEQLKQKEAQPVDAEVLPPTDPNIEHREINQVFDA